MEPPYSRHRRVQCEGNDKVSEHIDLCRFLCDISRTESNWREKQGNDPKAQAKVVFGKLSSTFDIEAISAAMNNLTIGPPILFRTSKESDKIVAESSYSNTLEKLQSSLSTPSSVLTSVLQKCEYQQADCPIIGEGVNAIVRQVVRAGTETNVVLKQSKKPIQLDTTFLIEYLLWMNQPSIATSPVQIPACYLRRVVQPEQIGDAQSLVCVYEHVQEIWFGQLISCMLEYSRAEEVFPHFARTISGVLTPMENSAGKVSTSKKNMVDSSTVIDSASDAESLLSRTHVPLSQSLTSLPFCEPLANYRSQILQQQYGIRQSPSNGLLKSLTFLPEIVAVLLASNVRKFRSPIDNESYWATLLSAPKLSIQHILRNSRALDRSSSFTTVIESVVLGDDFSDPQLTFVGEKVVKKCAAEIVLQVLASVALAQGFGGLQFNDLKPANILLDSNSFSDDIPGNLPRFLVYRLIMKGGRHVASMRIPYRGFVPVIADYGMAAAYKVPARCTNKRTAPGVSSQQRTQILTHMLDPSRKGIVEKIAAIGYNVAQQQGQNKAVQPQDVWKRMHNDGTFSLLRKRMSSMIFPTENKRDEQSNRDFAKWERDWVNYIIETKAIDYQREFSRVRSIERSFGITGAFQPQYDAHYFVGTTTELMQTWFPHRSHLWASNSPIMDDYGPIGFILDACQFKLDDKTGRPFSNKSSDQGSTDLSQNINNAHECSPFSILTTLAILVGVIDERGFQNSLMTTKFNTLSQEARHQLRVWLQPYFTQPNLETVGQNHDSIFTYYNVYE